MFKKFILCFIHQLGYYIYLPAKNVGAYSSAVLGSPLYKGSYSNCKMGMAFNMYGNKIGKLQVFLLQNGVERICLLKIEGNVTLVLWGLEVVGS